VESLKGVARKCPKCGSRFQVILAGKTLKNSERRSFEQEQLLPGGQSLPWDVRNADVKLKVPVRVLVNEYEYSYRCKRCDHKWSEVRTEEKKDSVGLKQGVLS